MLIETQFQLLIPVPFLTAGIQTMKKPSLNKVEIPDYNLH